jgi:uncharacterized protein
MRAQEYGSRAMLVFEAGESVMETLKCWLADHSVSAASFTAIGAMSQVTLRYFDTTQRRYLDRELHEYLEVLHLTGNAGLLQGGTLHSWAHLPWRPALPHLGRPLR